MAHAKRSLKQSHSTASERYNDRDAVIARLIAGINYLVVQSQEANLGTAARILCTAKEDMVHWAVDMNFHESARERFINDQLFGGTQGAGVTDLMTHIDHDSVIPPHSRSPIKKS